MDHESNDDNNGANDDSLRRRCKNEAITATITMTARPRTMAVIKVTVMAIMAVAAITRMLMMRMLMAMMTMGMTIGTMPMMTTMMKGLVMTMMGIGMVTMMMMAANVQVPGGRTARTNILVGSFETVASSSGKGQATIIITIAATTIIITVIAVAIAIANIILAIVIIITGEFGRWS